MIQFPSIPSAEKIFKETIDPDLGLQSYQGRKIAIALGLAGAGVYDWRLYDTIYTERYMRTPQENKSGYDRTSVIKAAKDLHGHLVIIHGTMDDNVHMQNTMQLLWALQSAGKQNFELMMYPRSRHGLDRKVRGHSQEFQWSRLKKLLDPAKKAG